MKTGNIKEVFRRSAESFETKTAIEHLQLEVSYQELAERSNNLANFLLSCGASKGSIVVILIENPVEVITAILGVLKASCVFVPLDPGTPNKRLEALIAEISPGWFVIESTFFGRICSVVSAGAAKPGVICVDGGDISHSWHDTVTYVSGYKDYSHTEEPAVDLDPNDMCYIYFTSGSTGRPKGIMGRLKGIDHFIRWEIKTLQIEPGTRVSHLTTPAFDASLRDIFVPLCSGGTICIPDERTDILDARKLINWIEGQKINLIHCVPSLFRLIVNENLNPEGFSALKYVLLAGEPLLPSDVTRWMDVYGERIQLVNLYGPSETTMTKLFYFVKSADKDRRAISIGKPMEGARALIVDARGKACPPGSVGEIYIRTPFRSLGYFNQPELTQKVFVSNPFSNDVNDLVYKTGDLGRLSDDGNFEFLGRRDQQVKVRGIRIELGEIEGLLQSHEFVKDAVVLDHEDASGNKYLCAYVVLSADVETAGLRAYLSKSLPEYMVPSTFIVMKILPRTLSGKVDRRSLPTPGKTRDMIKGPFVAARTPIEEVLAGIWSDVLGIDRVGIHDNFFELGGHSLLATQVISRVRAAFQVDVPLRSLFETPTVEAIAQNVEAALKAGNNLQAPAISRAARDRHLPLSFAQQRLWFLYKMEPDSPAYNICGAARLSGKLDIAALEQSIGEVRRRHEVLRTTFASPRAEPEQVIGEDYRVQITVEDLSEKSEGEREQQWRRVAEEEGKSSFDLERGPLIRVRLLRLSEEEHVLVYTMHHIVSDAWSMGVMVREAGLLYGTYSEGRESGLPELEVQYADYAIWQRECLTEVIEEQLSYWRQKLLGAPTVLELPGDRPRLTSRSYQGDAHYQRLPAALTQSLRDLSKQEGVTLFMTLLAGFQILLHKYTAQQDIVVGTDIANRNHGETEKLIGFFVNQLALRTDLSGNPTFRELLRRVREVTLGAYAHQDLPFDKLVGALQPERSLSHTPLFQVLFVLQNTPVPSVEFRGITLSPERVDNPTSKFDLILLVMETEGGLKPIWRYSTDLFEAATIKRMSGNLETLLESIVAHPDARLSSLDILSEAERSIELQQERKREEGNLKRFKNVKPRLVSLPKASLVNTEYLKDGETMPLVLRPNGQGIDLIEWASSERLTINSQLLQHGAILFRGFGIRSAGEFEKVATALCPELYSEYGDLPREAVSGRVYGSTPYPAEQAILFHNESSQMHCWPLNIFFCCLTPPQQGGETPIADCRKVYATLEGWITERLEEKGVMYVRNFTGGLDVSWQQFFRTTNRAEVETYCRSAGIEYEWKPDNRLRTRKVCRAVASHPRTEEKVMFNQVQAHHISFLGEETRESLRTLFAEDDLPRNVYWGDGEQIQDEVMRLVRTAYEEAAVTFKWEQGDVMMLDNMLVAHGRNAYSGDRKIVVAMGEMITDHQFQGVNNLS
jgi:amino acid adenylation domain-containing protein